MRGAFMIEEKDVLIELALKYKGDWRKIYQTLTDKDFDKNKIEVTNHNFDCGVVTAADKDYPKCLLNVFQLPFVIFYYGNISLLQNNDNNLGVIGTRDPTPNAVKKTREIIGKLPKDIVIVSGLASGIDGVAHEAALDYGHKTIAVLGCGINKCYPSINKELKDRILSNKDSLIISEYPPDVDPTSDKFPVRNRLISGCSSRILITEAKRRSGTSITSAYALDQGKEVLCLPSSNWEESLCNLLIKEEGILVENAEDVNYYFERRKLL